MSQNQKPSNFVDENRLWQNQMLLAQIGATPKGGVNRQALSSEEIEARKLLLSWSERLRLITFVDQIGNLFFRLNGTASQMAPV
ncbi:MAG: Zn-dependent hydrolase, partial [Pseudomonadota bacterium]|nr:Zn-dependent hydrolase [Pseudomonadota bacterium]